MRNDPFARNIAEVILDLFHDNAPPRCEKTMLQLVQHQIERVQFVTAKPLRDRIAQLEERLNKPTK